MGCLPSPQGPPCRVRSERHAPLAHRLRVVRVAIRPPPALPAPPPRLRWRPRPRRRPACPPSPLGGFLRLRSLGPSLPSDVGGERGGKAANRRRERHTPATGGPPEARGTGAREGAGGLPRATQFCRLNRNVTLHFAEGSASAASSCDLWQGASGVLGQIAWPLLLNLDSELERDRRRGVSGDPVGIAHPLEEARGTLKNWEGHPTCRAGQRERRPPS